MTAPAMLADSSGLYPRKEADTGQMSTVHCDSGMADGVTCAGRADVVVMVPECWRQRRSAGRRRCVGVPMTGRWTWKCATGSERKQ